jgi:hypothetical protein
MTFSKSGGEGNDQIRGKAGGRSAPIDRTCGVASLCGYPPTIKTKTARRPPARRIAQLMEQHKDKPFFLGAGF